MRGQRNFRSKLAVAFTGLYLFAFLFASNFHHHNAGYFYKDFQFKSGSKNFTQQSAVNNSDDCLSCHFASAPVLLPTLPDFSFTGKISQLNAFSNYGLQTRIFPHFNFYLRGPPAFS